MTIIPPNSKNDNYDNYVKSDRLFNASVKIYSGIELIEVYRSKNMRLKGAGGAVRGSSSRSEEERVRYQEQAAIRAGTSIRELILANNLRYLWTLTYKDEVTDREQAIDHLKKFIMRLRYRDYKFPYVGVMEIQEERAIKYGVDVIHFHLATSERVNFDDMEKAWGHGFVFVSEHSGELFKVASYLAKYVRKGFEDERVRGREKKRYLNSRGLVRPEKTQLILSDNELRELKEIADTVVEYEEGVWMQVQAVNWKGEDVQVNYYKNKFDQQWREFAIKTLPQDSISVAADRRSPAAKLEM